MSEAKRLTPDELATLRKLHFDTYDGDAGYCRACDADWPCTASLVIEEAIMAHRERAAAQEEARRLRALVEQMCPGASIAPEKATRFRVVSRALRVIWDSDLAYRDFWRYTREHRLDAAERAAAAKGRFIIYGESEHALSRGEASNA